MTTGEPSPYESPRQRADAAGTPRAGQPRRGFRRFVPLLIAAWLVLEIWLLLVVGRAIGALGVFLILVAGGLLGAVVIKRAGRRAWRNLTESLQPPGARPEATAEAKGRREGAKGGNGLAMLGGLLLMMPGLASDVLGLLCVFPPTAALLRKGLGRKLTAGGLGAGGLGEAVRQAQTAQEQVRIHRPDGKVVPGEVIREDGTSGTPGGSARGGEPEDGRERPRD